ncbi:MAG: thiamine phosphate synthase [Thermoguttaceae bacterium]|nr:thiamine phosphate synthase [Thermoguttaceae bacterium]
MSKREIYRILDAAANRGREALRVVEDAARFLEDDAELTARLKETRHRFAAAQNRFDRRERLDARDVAADVGTRVETEDEYRRTSLADVLAANFARLQEAARSLEEYSKIVAPEVARDWEQIRYAAYALEKIAFDALARRGSDPFEELAAEFAAPAEPEPTPATEPTATPVETPRSEPEPEPEPTPAPATQPTATPVETVAAPFVFGGAQRPKTDREARRARLETASLCVYVDPARPDGELRDLLRADIDVFQIVVDPNSENAPDAQTERFFKRWRETRGSQARDFESRPLLLLRDYVDWAAALSFDGATVDRGFDWNVARETLGPDALLGATVSTLEEAEAGLRAGELGVLDFLEVGPVFASQTGEPTGTALLRTIVDRVEGEPSIPLFAFGGVDFQNCDEAFDSGFERLAVGAAILNAPDKRAAASRFKCLF